MVKLSIKCSDELPKYSNDYETDLGTLRFMRYAKNVTAWYLVVEKQVGKSKHMCTSYCPRKPLYWIKDV